MKTIIKTAVVILSIGIFGSCKDENIADAYGNFEDDAVIVSAENAGKLVHYNIEEGMKLEKGKTVGVIDTTQLYLKKQVLLAGMKTIDSKAKSVESQKSVLQQQLDILLINQKRIEKMYEDGAATQKELDDINGEVKVTKQKIHNINIQRNSVLAEKQSLMAQIKQTNDLIEKSIVKNPINGTVLINFVKEAEFVAPGKPLYSVQDVDNLTLRAYVSETQLTSIKIGQKVKVEVDALKGTKTLDGTIYWVSSNAEFTPKQIQTKEERRNLVYAIKIRVNNANGILKIGMPANVYFK
ncbi:MAG: HlyD family efflux transporter periplasmic adaptor subunit [Chlorobi bacterium]|nr:HlyD family efflux transporter periplasmic adaptor subunit [Chlorobiota bacterium]